MGKCSEGFFRENDMIGINEKDQKPPEIAEKIIRKLYPDRGSYSPSGDFEEVFISR